jgi:hypothetical protein
VTAVRRQVPTAALTGVTEGRDGIETGQGAAGVANIGGNINGVIPRPTLADNGACGPPRSARKFLIVAW